MNSDLFKKIITAASSLLLLSNSLVYYPIATANAAGSNLILNPSVETSSTPGLPDSWQTNSWGTNTASFQYLTNSGHTGNASLKVTISSYTSGDAKWIFNPVSVTPGSTYTYSDFYQSNTSSIVMAQVTLTDGTTQYIYLGTDSASTIWKNASFSWTAPTTAASVTIFHLIQKVGYLTTDDFSLTVYTPPTITNGVLNSSVETASPSNPALPDSWQTDKWGTNTSKFSYLSTGHTGSRSLNVTVSSYRSGDAKWYFNPESIQPNTYYTFSDYYIANIQSDAVAQITHTNGMVDYMYLGTTPASSTWNQANFTFLTPTDASKITVFHLLQAVGSLTTDDFSLLPIQLIQNGVPNASLERATPDQTAPLNWFSDSWGTNNATFQYLNNFGNTGTHSVKVSMTSYSDGDAKWFYDPQPAQPNQSYFFDDYYQSTVTTRVTIQFVMSDGSLEFRSIGYLPARSTWTHAHLPFTTLPGTVKVTVLHLLQSVGSLTTDDYSVTPYTISPLSQGMVSYTFDDGYEVNYQNALPLLNKYGIKSTQYIISDPTQASTDPLFMTSTQVLNLYKQGHEIGNHAQLDPEIDLTTETASQVDTQLSTSNTYLTNLIGTTPISFAPPLGGYNDTTQALVNKYLKNSRGVDTGYNDLNSFNPMHILVQDVDPTVSIQTAQSWVDYANTHKVWLVLVFHSIANTPSDPFSWSPTNLDAILNYTVQTQTKVVRVDQGVSIMQGIH